MAPRKKLNAGKKIVVTGPFAAGKTTLIRTISEITVLSTERGISDATRLRKAQTTVALDFGRITIDRDLVLYLFGTPGQERFDFMWEILGEGMLGYVVVLDGTAADPGGDGRAIYDAFRRMAPGMRHVVAVNRGSGLDPDAEAELRAHLGLGAKVPIVPFDAMDRESVKSVLLALLHEVLEALERAPAAV